MRTILRARAGSILVLSLLLLICPRGVWAQGRQAPDSPTRTPEGSSTPGTRVQVPAAFDLAIQSVDVIGTDGRVDGSPQPTLVSGQPFKIRVRVKNLGSGAAPAGQVVVTVRSRGRTLARQTAPLGGLRAGTQQDLEVPMTLRSPASPDLVELRVEVQSSQGTDQALGNNASRRSCTFAAAASRAGAATTDSPRPSATAAPTAGGTGRDAAAASSSRSGASDATPSELGGSDLSRAPTKRSPQAGSTGSGRAGSAARSGPDEQVALDGARVPKGIRTLSLEVEQLGGEFEKWGGDVTFTAAQTVRFRWIHKTTMGKKVCWQLAGSSFEGGLRFELIDSGFLEYPEHPGDLALFNLDFKNYLPKGPGAVKRDYYLRLVPVDGQGKPVEASGSAPSQEVVVHFDSSLDKGPATLAIPATVIQGSFDCRLNQLYVGNADEDKFGDEPYLIAILIVADGNSIDLDDPESASVRVFASKGTQGNLGVDDVKQGTPVKIPASVGTFQGSLEPIAMPSWVPADVRAKMSKTVQPAVVAMLVVAMEEDGSPQSVADATLNTLVQGIQSKVDEGLRSRLPQLLQEVKIDVLKQVVQGGKVDDKAITDKIFQQLSPIFADIAPVIQEEVEKVATDETLSYWWNPVKLLAGVTDPDDMVGLQSFLWSIPYVETASYPISTSLGSGDAIYMIDGKLSIKVTKKEVEAGQ